MHGFSPNWPPCLFMVFNTRLGCSIVEDIKAFLPGLIENPKEVSYLKMVSHEDNFWGEIEWLEGHFPWQLTQTFEFNEDFIDLLRFHDPKSLQGHLLHMMLKAAEGWDASTVVEYGTRQST